MRISSWPQAAAVIVWLLATTLVCPATAADVETEEERLLTAFEAEWSEEPASFPDPFEGWNRGVFRFNRSFDRWTLDPVTRAYAFAVPEAGRLAVRRLFDNLNSPVVLVNDLLQGEWWDAGVIVSRFAINSTAGIGGLFDPASAYGLQSHSSDFGQTLAVAGVPSGPYLIIPVLGPTTLRDGIGTLVNVFFRPTTYFIAGADQIYYTAIYGGGSGLVTREENADGMRMLESSSVDYYAALRNAYYQVRTAEIWRRREQPDPRASAMINPG